SGDGKHEESEERGAKATHEGLRQGRAVIACAYSKDGRMAEGRFGDLSNSELSFKPSILPIGQFPEAGKGHVGQMSERPVAAVGDEGGARASLTAGFDVEEIVTDRQHVGWRQIPGIADSPDSRRAWLRRRVLARHDRIQVESTARQHGFRGP